MRINTNVMALNAQNMLSNNQNSVEKSIGRLSSGLRINGASDDASGLAISEKMRSQIRGLGQAQTNAQDGISLLQTAEGALQQTTDILQRMRELVIKAQNTGVLTDGDRTSISSELNTLRDEIDRISNSTTFNGKKLLNGDMETKLESCGMKDYIKNIDVSNAIEGTEYIFGMDFAEEKMTISWEENGVTKKDYSDVDMTALDSVDADFLNGKVVSFENAGIRIYFLDQVSMEPSALATPARQSIKTASTEVGQRAEFKIGSNDYTQDRLYVAIGDMSSKGLNKEGNTSSFKVDISSYEESNKTLEAINYAIDKVSEQRSRLGAVQNRIEYAANNLSTTEENLTAAESRIRDIDMAEEMVTYTKNSILNESAMAMLSQANKQPETILTLLQ